MHQDFSRYWSYACSCRVFLCQVALLGFCDTTLSCKVFGFKLSCRYICGVVNHIRLVFIFYTSESVGIFLRVGVQGLEFR
jgi:hypothetical protein